MPKFHENRLISQSLSNLQLLANPKAFDEESASKKNVYQSYQLKRSISLSDLDAVNCRDFIKEAVEYQEVMPIHLICSSNASEESQVKAIDSLRAKGVKLNSHRKDGKNALIIATEKGHLQVVQTLLKDLSIAQAEDLINYQNPRTHEYALLRAVQLGYQDIAYYLLSLKIDGKKVDTQFLGQKYCRSIKYSPKFLVKSESLESERNMPLICLVDQLHEDLFRELVFRTRPNVFIHGKPLIFHLIEKEKIELIDYLIQEHLVNLNLVSYEGISPLTRALEKNNPGIIQRFVSYYYGSIIITNEQTDLVQILMNLIDCQNKFLESNDTEKGQAFFINQFFRLLVIDLLSRLSESEIKNIAPMLGFISK